MDYYGGNRNVLDDVFVKTAVEVKRILPSLFNIKVVGIFLYIYDVITKREREREKRKCACVGEKEEGWGKSNTIIACNKKVRFLKIKPYQICRQ